MATTNPFPLPKPSQALKDIGKPDLDAVWTSINQWYIAAAYSHSQDLGLDHYGGVILLGLKHLIIEISAEYALSVTTPSSRMFFHCRHKLIMFANRRESQDDERRSQVARLLKPLIDANKWVSHFRRFKVFYRERLC